MYFMMAYYLNVLYTLYTLLKYFTPPEILKV
ncbi:hypothetical protein CULT_1570005 [[Clostridium] ultunense Esp]|nr:hypothetical protein CULT_1570005 [[Clostridium] ultunense Esp]